MRQIIVDSFLAEIEKISQRSTKQSKAPLIIGTILGAAAVGLTGAAAIKHYQAMKAIKSLVSRSIPIVDKMQKMVDKPHAITRFLIRRALR